MFYDEDDHEDGFAPEYNPLDELRHRTEGILSHGQFILRERGSEMADLETLAPCEADILHDPDEYNPFRYSYAMMIPELNMRVHVRFMLDDLDRTNLDDIIFTDPKNGVAYSVKLFPKGPKGIDPAASYLGVLHTDDWYRGDEYSLHVMPVIERAEILEVGDKPACLVTRQFVIDHVSPELLSAVLLDFKNEIEQDPACPKALACLLEDVTAAEGMTWRGGQQYGESSDEDEDDDEEDGWDSELDDEDGEY